MSMDSVTEIIAHFVGHFHTLIEQARMRETYEKFLADKAEQSDYEELPFIAAQFDARFQLGSYVPALAYDPPTPDIATVIPWSNVRFAPPDLPDFTDKFFAQWPAMLQLAPAAIALSYVTKTILPDVEPLGSIANYLIQKISLSDDDYFGVGDAGLLFSPEPVDNDLLLDFASQALSISPIADPDMPGSADAVADFITTAIEAFDSYDASSAPEGATVFVARSETLDGDYLNGGIVEELPLLDDYYDREPEDEPEPVGQSSVRVEGNALIEASVTLEAGGNSLINSASVTSFWTAATVTAVVGSHFELNAVIQINAWMDEDALCDTVSGWLDPDAAATQAFNLASFSRYDTFEEMRQPGDEPTFPKHWMVERIDGDVMIVNWLQQFTFMSDNDIGVLSSTGVTTSVIAGDNMAVNQISLFELAFAYDLIVIGGNVYDANIIQQLNVLFDNDLIGAVNGFSTTGNATASTSGNLLWNEASIYNVGGAGRFDALPDAYKAFADSLALGGMGAAGGVLGDAAFAGLGALKVLYISGDLIKLNYINQTNILGDSDQIALAMSAIDPVEDAQWTLTTGDNALINVAGISDLDSLGKTYVGGEQYSQDMLIQAEFISASPEFLGARDPNALVNEAVAFLVDDAADDYADGNSSLDPGYHPQDAGQSDGLQTMLA
jgi:hypothetical protein